MTVPAVVGVGFLLRGASSLVMATFGVFVLPVARDVAGTAAAVTTAFAALSLVSGASSPVIGGLADRLGYRWVLRGGAVLFVLGLAASAVSMTATQYVVAMGLVCGLGVTAFTQVPVNMVVARYVLTHRLPAFGVVTAGAGVAGLALLPLTERIISTGSWRTAYWLYAASVLVAWGVTEWTLGRVTDGGKPGAVHDRARALGRSDPGKRRLDLSRLVRRIADGRLSRSESQLVAAGTLSGLQRTVLVAFFVGWALAHGHSGLVAAQAFGIAEGMRATGGVVLSLLGFKINPRTTYVLCCLVAGVSIIVLLGSDTRTSSLFIVMAVYGFASGGIHPSSSALQASVYRDSRLGLLFGTSSAAFGLGGAAGVAVATAFSVRTGIDSVLWVVAVGLVGMALLVVGVRPEPETVAVPVT